MNSTKVGDPFSPTFCFPLFFPFNLHYYRRQFRTYQYKTSCGTTGTGHPRVLKDRAGYTGHKQSIFFDTQRDAAKPRPPCALPQQHRLYLPALQGRLHRLPDAGEVRHQGAGLALRVILPEGHERVIPLKADSSPYPIQPTNL